MGIHYGFAKAYAKLNLTLDVLSKRDDGYHDLDMVMQSISLCDTVSVRIGDGEGISVISNIRHIPNDERNIAYKAALAFETATGISCGGIHIAMEKRTPSSAGMAGGSADGAAVLRLLSELSDAHLSDEELCEIGVTVGADVPFCIIGGTALARGKGEILTRLNPIPDCFFVIGKPKHGASTKNVFAKIDSCPIPRHPDTRAMLAAIENGSLSGVCENVYNVFEPVVSEDVREILGIKNELLGNGAMTAAMTGSGSAVFGIFDSEAEACSAKKKLAQKYSEVFIARSVGFEKVREVCICK